MPAVFLVSQNLSLPPDSFVAQVFSVVEGLGGFWGLLRLSIAVTLLLSTVKVSLLKRLLWDPLGCIQVYVAPMVSLAAGLLSLGQGQEVTLAIVVTYLSAGAGSVYIDQMIEGLKRSRRFGPVLKAWLELVQRLLGGGVAERPRSIVK